MITTSKSYWYSGKCLFGERCTYLHVCPEEGPEISGESHSLESNNMVSLDMNTELRSKTHCDDGGLGTMVHHTEDVNLHNRSLSQDQQRALVTQQMLTSLGIVPDSTLAQPSSLSYARLSTDGSGHVQSTTTTNTNRLKRQSPRQYYDQEHHPRYHHSGHRSTGSSIWATPWNDNLNPSSSQGPNSAAAEKHNSRTSPPWPHPMSRTRQGTTSSISSSSPFSYSTGTIGSHNNSRHHHHRIHESY